MCCILFGTTQGAYELPALHNFLTQIIDGCLYFHFVRAIDEVSIVLGKFSLDVSPLSEPEGMLLKIYSGFELAPNAFDVSSEFNDYKFRVLKNRMFPFQHLVTGLKGAEQFMTILQTYIFVLERMILITNV